MMGVEFKGLPFHFPQMILSVRNYVSCSAWVPATVMDSTGPFSCWLQIPDDLLLQQHVDQMRGCMSVSTVTFASVSNVSASDAPAAVMVLFTSAQELVPGHVDMEPRCQNELEATETSVTTSEVTSTPVKTCGLPQHMRV